MRKEILPRSLGILLLVIAAVSRAHSAEKEMSSELFTRPCVLYCDLFDFDFRLRDSEKRKATELLKSLDIDLRKGRVSFRKWFMCEDQSKYYFISKESFSVINSNPVISPKEYVCESQLRRISNLKGLDIPMVNDPVLIKGKKYLFAGIKVAYLVTLPKKASHDDKGSSISVRRFIAAAKAIK